MLKTVSSASGGSSGFPITLGNTVVAAGSTITTLGNLTLNNVTINGTTENNVQFSNVNVISGNIANVAIANATITGGTVVSNLTGSTIPAANVTGLGTMATENANAVAITGGTIGNVTYSNVTVISGTEGNVTYSNVTINSGNATLNKVTANNVISTGNIAANVVAGAFSYGNLSYTDTGIVASYANSVNNYIQIVMQNTSNGNAASSDFALVNDTGSAYGDFGITSSTFSGSGRFYNANVVYLYGASVDLVVGTLGANATHFVANNSATDAMTLNANNTVTINTLNQPTSANATFATASLPLVPAGYITVNLNGTNVKIPYYAV